MASTRSSKDNQAVSFHSIAPATQPAPSPRIELPHPAQYPHPTSNNVFDVTPARGVNISSYAHAGEDGVDVGEQGEFDGLDGADSKKKSARACDQCRKSKVKCSGSESPNEACVRCKRQGYECRMSFPVRKRGPSKGYIQQITDRVINLERELEAASGGQRLRSELTEALRGDGYSPARELEDAQGTRELRKRSHSAYMQDGSLAQSSPAHLDGYQPASTAGYAGTRERRDEETFSYETLLIEYYDAIHSTFPLLPYSEAQLRERIGDSPPDLKTAFMAALTCTVRSCPFARLPRSSDPAKDLHKVHGLVTALKSESTLSQQIMRVQILLLMAIEALNHGPYWKNGYLFLSHREWLYRATAAVERYGFKRVATEDKYGKDDVDASHHLARRLYWLSFVLDRWQALRDGSRCLMDYEPARLKDDRAKIGSDTFELVTEMLEREQYQE